MKLCFPALFVAIAFWSQSSFAQIVTDKMILALEHFKSFQLENYENNRPVFFENNNPVHGPDGRQLRYQLNGLFVDEFKTQLQGIIDKAKGNPTKQAICFSAAYFKSAIQLMDKYNILNYVPRPGYRCEVDNCQDPDRTAENVLVRRALIEDVMRKYLFFLNNFSLKLDREADRVSMAYSTERYARRSIELAVTEAQATLRSQGFYDLLRVGKQIVEQQKVDLRTVCQFETN